MRQWCRRASSRCCFNDPLLPLSEHAPTTNPFLTKSKKSDDRHVLVDPHLCSELAPVLEGYGSRRRHPRKGTIVDRASVVFVTQQKHDRRSYLSVGVGGDSHSLLEREPTRSKDGGLRSYN